MVVLDPGGDMAKQIARWPELVRDDRVILIEPGLQKGKTVGFNPLDGFGLDEVERAFVATFWAQQIGALTSEVSPQMERLARNCVHVLLAYPGGANVPRSAVAPRCPRQGREYRPPGRAFAVCPNLQAQLADRRVFSEVTSRARISSRHATR